MPITLEIAAGWDERPETLDAAAARLAGLLGRLGNLHPAFTAWYKKAKSKKSAMKPFCNSDVQPEAIRDILADTSLKDDTGCVMEGSGFRTSAWNGGTNDVGVDFNIRFGLQGGELANTNRFSINITAKKGSDLLTRAKLEQVVSAIVIEMNPDYLDVRSSLFTYGILSSGGDIRLPSGGWMTYLSSRFASLIDLSTELSSIPFPGGGVLIKTSDESLQHYDGSEDAKMKTLHNLLSPVRDFASGRR